MTARSFSFAASGGVRVCWPLLLPPMPSSSEYVNYYLFFPYEFFFSYCQTYMNEANENVRHTSHTMCSWLLPTETSCMLRRSELLPTIGASSKYRLFLFHYRLLWTFYFSFFSIRFGIVDTFVCDRNKFALKAERKIKQTVANFRGEDIFFHIFFSKNDFQCFFSYFHSFFYGDLCAIALASVEFQRDSSIHICKRVRS